MVQICKAWETRLTCTLCLLSQCRRHMGSKIEKTICGKLLQKVNVGETL